MSEMEDRSGLLWRRCRRPRLSGVWSRALLLGLLIAVMSPALAGCSPDARTQAQTNKTRLDKEFNSARAAGVPDGLLQPIQAQEVSLASSASSGTDKAYAAAANGYTKLYQQVVDLERMTPDQARAQTTKDLQTFTAALKQVQAQNLVEAQPFEPRLQQAQQQLAAATTTKDYFAADDYILRQSAAAQQIIPTYQQLQALSKLVDNQATALGAKSTTSPLQCAYEGVESFWLDDPSVTVTTQAATYPFQQWPDQNLAMFRTATSLDTLNSLQAQMRAQTMQLTADATAFLPAQAAAAVDQFKQDVQTYQQSGGTDATYAQQATDDAHALSAAHTVEDFSKVTTTVRQHEQALQLPLLKVKTSADLNALQKLIDQGQASKTINPADNLPYPNAYEYADHNSFNPAFKVGIQDAQDRLAQAKTADDYRAVDQEIQMFTVNITAMLRNLQDNTSSNKPHQTDLDLMSYYGVSSGNNIVVSLREQKARIYSNGKLLKAFDVTTGSMDKPTPPGIHCVLSKASPDLYKSPDPPGSPLYYKPTPVHFSMWYSQYGFYLHDSWWRDDSTMGKYSNLPHYDPIAFNNGSHGCINFHYANGDMGWVYNFAQIGTPVIVY